MFVFLLVFDGLFGVLVGFGWFLLILGRSWMMCYVFCLIFFLAFDGFGWILMNYARSSCKGHFANRKLRCFLSFCSLKIQ